MKILVVDDHGLFRDGVCQLLRRMDIGIEVILEAADAQTGLALAAKHSNFSIILLDINLPDLAGVAMVRAFRQACLTSSLVLLSAVDDLPLIRRCMNEGAQGFMHKSAPADSILAALRRLLDGESIWLDPFARHTATIESELCGVHLTQRQNAVLTRMCQGWSNKEIARDLSISDNTVRIHVAAILQALGVKNRSEAIVVANKLGLEHA
jgi:DNA-binding NarL/FixJ family response regulator